MRSGVRIELRLEVFLPAESRLQLSGSRATLCKYRSNPNTWPSGLMESKAERKGHLLGDIFTLCGRRPDDESPICQPYKSNGERQEQEEKGSLPADLAIPLQSW